jgi:histidine triad (HIT) family protein
MPPQGDQCPYCQLIDNPQQLMVVAETDNFYAWLEVQPRAKGHTQIVPKEHKESVLDFTPQEYDEAMSLVREVVVKAKKGLEASGASVTMNIGDEGGQMLDHAYISVFPRFEEDENAGTPTGAIFQHREDLQDEEKLKQLGEEMSSVEVSFGEPVEPHPESQKFKEDQNTKETSQQETKEGEEVSKEEEEEEIEPEHDGKSFEWK